MRVERHKLAWARLLAAAAFALAAQVGGRAQSAQPPPQPSAADRAKLRRAEEVADAFVRRLHETLDYGVPFREFFTTDPELLGSAELHWPLGLGPGAEQLYGRGVPERAHVAFMNVWYLRNLYCEARGIDWDGLPAEMKALGGEELFPGIDSGQSPRQMKLPEMRSDAARQLARLERLAALFRRGLPPKVFERPSYRAKVAEYEEASRKAGRLARVEYGGEFARAPKGAPVYVVRREFLDYYLAEGRGGLKVVFVHILPDFRWPGL